MELKMHKLFLSLFLMAQLSCLYANEQDITIPTQVKQDFDRPLLSDFSKQASGSFITVGGDTLGCHFNNIQDAIDSIPFSETGEIRIATNKTYHENLLIDDINVSLIGGYDDCFDQYYAWFW